MADINFTDYQTIVPAAWLQDVNNAVYRGQTPTTATSTGIVAYNTSGQNIPTGANTAITNWTTVQDQGLNFNATTGIFTAAYTGFYQFSASISFENSLPVNTEILLAIFVNGTEVQEVISYVSAFNGSSLQIAGLIHMNAGQGAYLSTFQNSGLGQPLWINNTFRNRLSIVAVN